MVVRLLDVTRLVRRAGLVMTGVDRVEFAYLDKLTKANDCENFAIARTSLGYVLLDQSGMRGLVGAIEKGTWAGADTLSRLNPRLTPAMRRGQSQIRRGAMGRCLPNGLLRLLRAKLPDDFCYYNVGHSNLSDRMLRAVKQAGGRTTVLLHDTIPLDWPDMQRDGTVAAFSKKVFHVKEHAERVICATNAVAADVARHMSERPLITVAPLGVKLSKAEPLDPEIDTTTGYFVSVGTIEPRKNHALLLDIWDAWEDAPPLYICGRRGWKNEETFARLDAGVRGVTELADLSDGQITHLLAHARALVFPSFAEGFGIPPVEALALGTPAVVSDLPACREVLGDTAIYLDPSNPAAWENTLRNMTLADNNGTKRSRVPPDWDTHFKLVFTKGW